MVAREFCEVGQEMFDRLNSLARFTAKDDGNFVSEICPASLVHERCLRKDHVLNVA
jgi:hypothetical protein